MPSGGGNQTTIQKSEPWAEQKPYYIGDPSQGIPGIFPEAAAWYLSSNPQYYPNSTVAGFAPETDLALQAQANRALAGSPLNAAAQNQAMGILGGQYLNANPYLQGAIDAAAGGITRNYQNVVAPTIAGQFSQAGRYGSGAHQAALDQANQALAGQLGGIAQSMAYQNYGDERQNMMAALGMAPGLAQQDYFDIQQLANVGAARQQHLQDLINADVERWNFNQNLPWNKLANYSALVGQPAGTTQTTIAPSQRPSAFETIFGGLGGLGGLIGAFHGPG